LWLQARSVLAVRPHGERPGARQRGGARAEGEARARAADRARPLALARSLRRALLESSRASAAAPRRAACRRVLEPGRRAPVLDPEPLGELRGVLARVRELLARALAERRCERVDLPDGRPCVLHASIEPEKASRVCADFEPFQTRPGRPADEPEPTWAGPGSRSEEHTS